jgi:hypothetical protein
VTNGIPPRREEIFRRASEEYGRVAARCEANRAEVARQERAALCHLPVVKAAFDAYDQALAAAELQYEDALTVSQDAASVAESDALSAQADAENAALALWQQTTDDLDSAHSLAKDNAKQDYDAAYHDAMALVGPERDARLAEARAARDAAMKSAERDHRRNKALAWSTYQKTLNDARETAISVIEKARGQQQRAAERAGLARARALEVAETALRQDLAAEPLAASIQEAFRLRLQQVELDCEREKTEVLERMQRDLAPPQT